MKRDLQKLLSYTEPKGDCLEWTKCYNTDGYPRAAFENSNGKVHRVVWELVNSKSAQGYVVRHSCDNPRCINPKHLLLGTPTDNMRDRDERDRHGAAKLNHEKVKQAREMYLTKEYTQLELANMFGVHLRTMNSLLNKRHWKTLT